ncbi:MAG: S41 family peptidase [Chloroflexi bacterium]|nr:S41 family peptidase [Chloroflexota bacterium]
MELQRHKEVERFEAGSLAFGLTTFQLITITIALIIAMAVSFLGGILYSRQTDVAYSEEFIAFWEAWNIIEEEFYRDPPDSQERVYAALTGLTQSLNDPYTFFSPPVEAEQNREFFSGVFGGIGAIVDINSDGEVFIVRPMEGNPAQKAGIEAGDIIRAVDGQSVEGMSVGEVVDLITGEVGTEVTITIFRPGTDEVLEFTVIRAEIERVAVASRMIDNVGYIYLQDFSAVASSQVERELQALLNQDARAIIFDMRGNGGGLLTEAVEVADLYLPDGLVLTEEDRESVIEEFFSQTGDIGESIPLVVLIDGGTASASEIVAGAIQDRDRAPLIGQQSFGKASVQNLQALNGGGELRITRAAWFTPGKQDINGVGLTPDVVVEGDQFDEEGNDRVLDTALEYIDTHYLGTKRTAFLFGG